jgi:hypothetical protein
MSARRQQFAKGEMRETLTVIDPELLPADCADDHRLKKIQSKNGQDDRINRIRKEDEREIESKMRLGTPLD